MSTVAEIIEAVKQLDERQKGEFIARLTEVDFDDARDAQIERDVAAGKFDALRKKVHADDAATL